MRLFRRPHPLVMFSAWFLVVFNVLFPKGGFKVGPMPITWGYVFIALSTPLFVVYRLLALPLQYRKNLYCALLCIFPMQALYVYTGVALGIVDMPTAAGNAISFIALPWIFFLIYGPFLAITDGARLATYLRFCILFAAIWGIFLFVWHPITGHYVEIPFLTVNIADYGRLEATKHIDRGFFFKLISTYNNGNLYGVATLILLPLYELLEPRKSFRLTLKVALVLTLSRTVWLGLVLYELFPVMTHLVRQARFFPRFQVGNLLGRLIVMFLTVILIVGVLAFSGLNLGFLMDPTAGGRLSMLAQVFRAGFLPAEGLRGPSETVYFSITFLFGFLGLGCFLLLMFSPVLLLAVDRSALSSPTRMAACKGLLLYAVVAAIDGAINYIPVLLFYWFVYMIFLYGWPGESTGAFVLPKPLPKKRIVFRGLSLPRRKRSKTPVAEVSGGTV
ncbi:MAG: hypothetical protein PW792_00080 [Acidobacteriaceae bacterium]|nr:hypothetical protein [Acidobacteriaceae bacterium]